MQITRRQLLSSAVVISVLPPAAAQEPAPDWNQISRDATKHNLDALAKIDIPVGAEPAFVFRP